MAPKPPALVAPRHRRSVERGSTWPPNPERSSRPGAAGRSSVVREGVPVVLLLEAPTSSGGGRCRGARAWSGGRRRARAGAVRPAGLARLRWCQVFEQGPRDGGRAAAIAQCGDLQDPPAALRQGHAHDVARAQGPRRLGPLRVDVDLAAVARVRGQAARLEDAGRPQPLVDPHGIERFRHGQTVS